MDNKRCSVTGKPLTEWAKAYRMATTREERERILALWAATTTTRTEVKA